MPSDLTLKTMNAVHRVLLGLSRGRLGWTVANMPALELTTTGRRSGEPRKVWLTSPVQEGPVLVVDPARCTPALRAELNFNILAAAFAKGHVDFTDGKSRLVGTTIYAFQSPYPVGSLTDDLARAVDDCPTFTYPDTPESTTTVRRFTTPGLGDESIGMHFRTTSTSSSEPPVDVGIEITRVGMFDVLATTEYVEGGKLDTSLLAALTRAAVGRML